MKIQKGIVKYKDRNDIVCIYGVTDDGKQYYFLGEDDKQLKNGNRIASTALVEAIDPMVKASNIGLIDENGNEVIAFDNQAIKLINDDIILVEKAQPVSQSVINAINLKNDPAEAAKLVSTPATIKGRLNAKMGPEGRYFFNDQFSEATVCDINGNNLVNDEYFSFIGMANGKLYFSKNTEDSEISEYSILPPEVQSDVTPTNDGNEIDVSEVEVPKEVVENALNSENIADDSKSDDGTINADSTEVSGAELPADEDSSIKEVSTSEEETATALEDNGTVVDNSEENAFDNAETGDEVVSETQETEEPSQDDITSEETVTGQDDEESDLVAFANNGDLPEDAAEDENEETDDVSEQDTSLEEENAFDEEDTDDVFKDSILKADSIVKNDDFEDAETEVAANDNIMTDVANSMNSLINLNKKQKEVISQYKDEIDKLNFANRGLELKVTKIQAKNKVLEEKLRSQEQLIARQVKELEEIRPQLAGKDELVKLLADAQVLLGQDDYSEGEPYYKKAA